MATRDHSNRTLAVTNIETITATIVSSPIDETTTTRPIAFCWLITARRRRVDWHGNAWVDHRLVFGLCVGGAGSWR